MESDSVIERDTDEAKGPDRPRSAASRRHAPDYSRLRQCDASEEELARFGASSVVGMVIKMNADFEAAGMYPVTQADFPGTRKRFDKLVARWNTIPRAV
jgi:hypothetical protein